MNRRDNQVTPYGINTNSNIDCFDGFMCLSRGIVFIIQLPFRFIGSIFSCCGECFCMGLNIFDGC
jgi:hypothetical protein